MLPALWLLRAINVRGIVVFALIGVGLFLVFVQGGVLADIIAEMLGALSPF